jgi:hypothetical protein
MTTAPKKVKCNICLDDDVKNPLFTPCIHGFCSECISQWLNEKRYELRIPCPVCKHDISELAGPRDPSTLFHDEVPNINSDAAATEYVDTFLSTVSFFRNFVPWRHRESKLQPTMRGLGIEEYVASPSLQAISLQYSAAGNSYSPPSNHTSTQITADTKADINELLKIIMDRKLASTPTSQPNSPPLSQPNSQPTSPHPSSPASPIAPSLTGLPVQRRTTTGQSTMSSTTGQSTMSSTSSTTGQSSTSSQSSQPNPAVARAGWLSRIMSSRNSKK